MCGHRRGLVRRIREEMQDKNVTVNFIRAKGLNHRQFKAFLDGLRTEYGDVLYHTDVRWLSQGNVLQRFFKLREEIHLFMESKGKYTTEFRDETFLREMSFLCDITSHLNEMNLQLQGRGRVISDLYSTVKAFKTKMSLWETQMRKENLSHFPSCQTMKEKLSTTVFPTAQFADKLSMLAADFRRRFADFEAQKSRFELLINPFGVDVESAPPNLL
ncbi:General transcription factor II-I repeat domain-containing protein 2B [Larimichthys crocea]|uniref:General transcription factor II-I repeat domain-containing protein 2B n=1 Tax=Larimichthys crocea TaxID=215358 RepID=A0A6G0HF00_LARCR|nr:General transcription factor II-I repeat domain-containing protein 2B [Larimichthys crocea]